MYQEYRIGAVILMGGSGCRFGGKTPKQFLFLQKKRIYLHTLDVFTQSNLFDEIILVCPSAWIKCVENETFGVKMVSGGNTRQESSYLGLKGFSSNPDIVVIHDAVRPFVSTSILLDNIQQTIIHGAVNTCISSADTLVYAPNGERIEDIPKRENFLRGQTPQTFLFDRILEAHESARKDGVEGVSDDCRLVLRKGFTVHIVKGNENNIKITTKTDLLIAKQIKKIGILTN